MPSDKILADVQAGKIDADTGLMYRIFASFADPRLPAEYAGGAPDIDDAALAEAAYRQANGSLPPAVQEAVRPYLLRPTNPDSAFYGTASTGLNQNRIGPAVFLAQDQPACGANGWATLKSDTQPVKVWVRCDDARLAGLLRDALEAAETLYNEESDPQMMGPAILDTGALLTDAGKDAGGDNSIDIYFTPKLVCVHRAADCTTLASLDAAGMALSTAPYSASTGAWTSSSYIVIDRAYGDSRTDLWSLIAHEMFHVLQDAHNVGGRIEGGKFHWFTEASAKWAQQYFVPASRPQWTYPWFSVFQAATVGLTSTANRNQYASFAWAYFMEQKAKWSSIGDAWRAIDGKVGWEAVNAAMASVFSFETNYKDFAVQALNTRLNPGDPAAPEMQVPDATFPQTAPSAGATAADGKEIGLGVLGPRAEGDALRVPVNVPALAMRYHVFGVAPAVKKLVVDFTGVQPSQALDVEALLHIQGKGWERRALSDGKTTFCLDDPKDHVDGGVLVIADHSWADAEALTGSYTLAPSDKPCDLTKLHLGGTVTWTREETVIIHRTDLPDWQRHLTVNGTAQIVLLLEDSGYTYELTAERGGGSTYSYDYSFKEEGDPDSGANDCETHETGTLETSAGSSGEFLGDFSIGQLNPIGGLFEDIDLSISIQDWCGPQMGMNVPEELRNSSIDGFIDCPQGRGLITAKFDGKSAYVIDCSYQYDHSSGDTTDTGSGKVSGTLTFLDGPHPTPR